MTTYSVLGSVHSPKHMVCPLTLWAEDIVVQLWWTLAHFNIAENEEVNVATKLALQGTSNDDPVSDVLASCI